MQFFNLIVENSVQYIRTVLKYNNDAGNHSVKQPVTLLLIGESTGGAVK